MQTLTEKMPFGKRFEALAKDVWTKRAIIVGSLVVGILCYVYFAFWYKLSGQRVILWPPDQPMIALYLLWATICLFAAIKWHIIDKDHAGTKDHAGKRGKIESVLGPSPEHTLSYLVAILVLLSSNIPQQVASSRNRVDIFSLVSSLASAVLVMVMSDFLFIAKHMSSQSVKNMQDIDRKLKDSATLISEAVQHSSLGEAWQALSNGCPNTASAWPPLAMSWAKIATDCESDSGLADVIKQSQKAAIDAIGDLYFKEEKKDITFDEDVIGYGLPTGLQFLAGRDFFGKSIRPCLIVTNVKMYADILMRAIEVLKKNGNDRGVIYCATTSVIPYAWWNWPRASDRWVSYRPIEDYRKKIGSAASGGSIEIYRTILAHSTKDKGTASSVFPPNTEETGLWSSHNIAESSSCFLGQQGPHNRHKWDEQEELAKKIDARIMNTKPKGKDEAWCVFDKKVSNNDEKVITLYYKTFHNRNESDGSHIGETYVAAFKGPDHLAHSTEGCSDLTLLGYRNSTEALKPCATCNIRDKRCDDCQHKTDWVIGFSATLGHTSETLLLAMLRGQMPKKAYESIARRALAESGGLTLWNLVNERTIT